MGDLPELEVQVWKDRLPTGVVALAEYDAKIIIEVSVHLRGELPQGHSVHEDPSFIRQVILLRVIRVPILGGPIGTPTGQTELGVLLGEKRPHEPTEVVLNGIVSEHQLQNLIPLGVAVSEKF